MAEKDLNTVSPALAGTLIDFAGGGERMTGIGAMQLDGTVAAYNMLVRNRVAYVADEVGMGKTYVALGVMSLLRFFNPRARVVVISPRENLQQKWVKELNNFVRVNWLVEGNQVKSIQGGPAWAPVVCNSLVEFAHEALLSQDRDFFLRMTSFSIRVNDEEIRKELRRRLMAAVPWMTRSAIPVKDPLVFRDAFGCALNAVVPEADLVVVDEGHNLKHGFSERGSIRNRVMGMAFGHPEGGSPDRPWFGARAQRVLLLSATPFEEDYGAIARQFEIFGLGGVDVRDGLGSDPIRMSKLLDATVPEDLKREIVSRLMIRRVATLKIGGVDHTKNMYRREWRGGGYRVHDEPMAITDPRQRLSVALVQKKVAEVLQDERFNNQFQIGMLASFESFLQTFNTSARKRKGLEEAEEVGAFDGEDQKKRAKEAERQGIDTAAVARVVESHRETFGTGLPHPKLDATAASLEDCFACGEKTLVFVRRVASVEELAALLDAAFDHWLRERMETALPALKEQIAKLFKRYENERKRRPDEVQSSPRADVVEGEPGVLDEEREEVRYVDQEDEGGMESFFAWFFRGDGPRGVLSGAAFQKNRLASFGAVDSTLFEDNHVAWLLGYPEDVLQALSEKSGHKKVEIANRLRLRGFAHFRAISRQKRGYPRLKVFEAYQLAALELLEGAGGRLGKHARVVREERYPEGAVEELEVPREFQGPEEALNASTFFTVLVARPELRAKIWPDEERETFRATFRRREQRREMISAMVRLGAAYIDLYLVAMRKRESLDLGKKEVEEAGSALAVDFADLLEAQRNGEPGLAYRELSQAAGAFDLVLTVNFPGVPAARLEEVAGIYAATLQRQVPVGRMAGGVNKRLVRQFRMPGFPFVLVTTEVLQEGEDLHTFCKKVIHYGVPWTPSAFEQRTGRVDRIHSLFQRVHDGSDRRPLDHELIQVYIPYLSDTVEVLQVRRVLKRLNRFSELIHKTRRGDEDLDSKIDAAREVLEELEAIPQIKGVLESAFPVKGGWLSGNLTSLPASSLDLGKYEEHLERLWTKLLNTHRIDDRSAVDGRRRKRGVAWVRAGAVLPKGGSEEGAQEQSFEVQLLSQVSGDAVILDCSSYAGRVDLGDDEVVDRICRLQSELGNVKICARPEGAKREDAITLEGEIVFGPQTTEGSELSSLVSRVVGSAAVVSVGIKDGA